MSPRMVTVLLLVLCFCLRNCACTRVMSREEELELERQLQSLNKPPVKTIQLKNGDIIDCVDIYKQPAFENPLLKNHKIQLQPTSFPAQMQSSAPANDPVFQTLSKRKACPDGTVPIHRTTKNDLVMAKTISHQMFRNIGSSDPLPKYVHQLYVKLNQTEGVKYYGVYGSGTVYNPKIDTVDQSSSANVWVKRGPPDEINSAVAGWMVSPSATNDSITRVFAYWTISNGKAQMGCFNLLCPGFIQVHPAIAPGSRVEPVSIVGGKTFDCRFIIYQDTQTFNWWLVISEGNITVGYWPKEIFPHLRDGADEVGWGGTTMADQTLNIPFAPCNSP